MEEIDRRKTWIRRGGFVLICGRERDMEKEMGETLHRRMGAKKE